MDDISAQHFLSHRKLMSVPLSLVDPTPFNPPIRMDVKRRAGLKDSLKTYGQLEPIHTVLIDGRYVVADGNCRRQSLIEAGAEAILAYVYEGGMEMLHRLYEETNERQTLKNGHMLIAALKGGPTFNTSVKSTLAQLHSLFPHEERQMLINGKVTPTMFNVAKKMAKYMLTGAGIGIETPTGQRRVRNNLLYLMRNDAQQAAIAYMRLGYSAEALRKAVDDDRPVPRTTIKTVTKGKAA